MTNSGGADTSSDGGRHRCVFIFIPPVGGPGLSCARATAIREPSGRGSGMLRFERKRVRRAPMCCYWCIRTVPGTDYIDLQNRSKSGCSTCTVSELRTRVSERTRRRVCRVPVVSCERSRSAEHEKSRSSTFCSACSHRRSGSRVPNSERRERAGTPPRRISRGRPTPFWRSKAHASR